jgi:PAS domain S-box-containing protein
MLQKSRLGGKFFRMNESEKKLTEALDYIGLLSDGLILVPENAVRENNLLRKIYEKLEGLKSSFSTEENDSSTGNLSDQGEHLLDRSTIQSLNFPNRNDHHFAFSKVFFNSIVSSLNDAIWSISVDLSTVYFANPAFEVLSGYFIGDILLDSGIIRKMVHPEDIYIYQNASVFFNEYGFANCQYRIITKENELKWVFVKSVLIKDEEGHPIRVDNVMSDITESKKGMEKELHRASELLLQQEVLFRLSCLGSDQSLDEKLKQIMKETAKVTGTERASVWVFDKNNVQLTSRCIYHLGENRYYKQMVLTEEQYPEYFKTLKEIPYHKSIIAQDVRNEHFSSKILEDYLLPLGISSMMLVPISKDNELFGIVSLSHVGEMREWSQDDQSFLRSISNIVSTFFEVEERRIIEYALIEKTRVLLEAQNVARIGNYMIDLRTGTWNSSTVFDQIFGINRSYLKNVKNWLKLISSEHSQHIFRVYKQIIRQKTLPNKKRFDESFKIIRKNDGEERWVTVLGEFQFDEAGEPTHMLGTMQDITERKNTELDLIKAKELAEILLTIKGDFISNMSHEIRTPLNAILGFTRFLMESPLDADQKEMMEAIDFSGKNLLVIVNDILDFSKMEANKMSFESIGFGLSNTIKNTLNLMMIKAEEKELRLFHTIDSAISDKLVGDPTRLNQILINLVGNAIKFTDRGSVKVELNLLFDRAESVEIEFSICDTGIGIAPGKMDSIFESFNQGTNDVTRKFGGSGLGLTITKKMIELQGGQIRVESEEGRGSKFIFSLSYKKQIGDEFDWSEEAEKNVISPGFLSTQRILVAEDTLINQLLARKIFLKWNCKIDIANNGKIAIEQLQENDYDLVLMDIQMPEMDGHAATQYIRGNLGEKSNIPIIALSAHASESEQIRCIQSGMNALISKPIDEEVLLEELFRWHVRKEEEENSAVKPVELAEKRKQETEGVYRFGHQEKGIIDFNYLHKVTNGDVKFMKELLEVVRVEMPKSLLSIEKYYSNENALELRREIHKLKASITIFGIGRGQDLIFQMETKIDETDSVNGIGNSLTELIGICSLLLEEFKALDLQG